MDRTHSLFTNHHSRLMDFKGKTVLITGPSSGIGRDLADLFAQRGAGLILVSRRTDELNRLAADLQKSRGIKAHVIPSDLAAPGSPEKLVADIRRRGLSVDVLVNNAGYGVYGKFHEEEIVPQMGMIQLHVATPTYLSYAFLPDMFKNGGGGILNVASTGGFQAVPIENVYCATKAYLIHFSEALAEELRGTPVRVTCLCPGPTETAFFGTALMKSTLPVKLSRMDSRTVALLGFEAFLKAEPLVITGLRNRLMVMGARMAPRR